jgi:hypothetical protein
VELSKVAAASGRFYISEVAQALADNGGAAAIRLVLYVLKSAFIADRS